MNFLKFFRNNEILKTISRRIVWIMSIRSLILKLIPLRLGFYKLKYKHTHRCFYMNYVCVCVYIHTSEKHNLKNRHFGAVLSLICINDGKNLHTSVYVNEVLTE